jgi:hypothetical protein
MVNVFGTSGSDVLVGTTGNDVLVGDPQGPSLKVISLLGSGLAASGASGGARFSPDGNRVVFQSVAADLVTGDTNGKTDILIKNLLTRNIDRVSVNVTLSRIFRTCLASGHLAHATSALRTFSVRSLRVKGLFTSSIESGRSCIWRTEPGA